MRSATTRLLAPLVFLLWGWIAVWWMVKPAQFSESVRLDAFLDNHSKQFLLPIERAELTTLNRTIVLDQAPKESLALLLMVSTQTIEAELNGTRLERKSLRSGRDTHSLRQSFLYPIPRELLHSGGNSLSLNVWRQGNDQLALADVWFGPQAELAAHFQKLITVRVTLPQIAGTTAVVVALFAALLWLGRPKETLYGWFALGVFLWVIYLMHFIWNGAPLTGPLWMAVIHTALAGSLLAIRRFCRIFLNRVPNALDRTVDLFAVLASLVVLILALAVPESSSEMAQSTTDTRIAALFSIALNVVLRLALLLQGLGLVLLLLKDVVESGNDQAAWLASATVLGLSLGFWDSAVVLGWLPMSSVIVFHLGILPLVMVFGVMLLRRFQRLLDATEAQNILLDQRVRDNASALEQAFSTRTALEREKLLADERHRVATDLHDGAGSLLVSLLSAVRRDGISQHDLAQALSEAIADLRLVMDSMDSMGSDLAEALGQFRSRLEPRLSAGGLKSIWRTASLSDGLKLSPRRTLNIFRALQESLVNVQKHADATQVEISAQEIGTVLHISVKDNGRGLPDMSTRPNTGSRGLQNLDVRMKSLGGYAKFEPASDHPSKPGLCVSLYVPIPNANETKW